MSWLRFKHARMAHFVVRYSSTVVDVVPCLGQSPSEETGQTKLEQMDQISNCDQIQRDIKDTCINFTTDLSHAPDEGIEVFNIYDGTCGRSGVGKTDPWHQLSIHCTVDGGTVAHELLHALGLKHEHQRDDARNYVKLNQAKIAKNWIQWYEPLPETNNFGFPYDFGSIMHCPSGCNSEG
ncbi:hypothetical protein GPALN_012094 [Globodera pallida]|nr:hypothetical protein GPALN_012094 [Globodera pallida]